MEEIKKKLEELKKEVYYAKHADLSIIDKIDVKVKELDELIKNHGVIGHVSKRSIIEIDFAGNLKAQIETTDKQPKILKAMNGYGNAIDVEYVTIETDC